MLSWRVLLCVIIITVLQDTQSASLPFLRPAHIGETNNVEKLGTKIRIPAEMIRARVREGVPPPLCAGRCVSPPAGPVCAFDATGTARTFATLCELEAVSCRESTYYAITSNGEC
ncbi:uncharacterized protein LOC125066669 [Vanessa atalanta]|uniref:uncharacterized protein LOC125066669 n=1 Tax=Vanessa atalanta TaxID=42275 RepID=UPI000E7782DF|nr:uncharacterized protein LOC113402580 [Vanessa tameamea]XP_047530830.1 uncharacterized protein LOC125066669 [Vanessa atalanta]